jgi:serine/threonine-protein kinase RsbT
MSPPDLSAAATATLARTDVMVSTEYDVASVIGAVNRLCAGQGLSRVFTAHVATAASELANNLWMYAERGGQVQVALLKSAGRLGVELAATDDGPGIGDIAQALSEGYSSGGGMGCGLPGVQRLMDEFSIDSFPGRGTCVVARKWQQARP